MKKFPIGIQTFGELIKENYVYVDKTKQIYKLITEGKCYFLSRPRRFGKSLLVSTLAEIFSGNKDLFDGLAINNLPYDWQSNPVIKISFAGISYATPDRLENGLKLYLQTIAVSHNIALQESLLPGEMLTILVMKLSIQNKVVLLVDEYDYAMLQHVHEPSIAEDMLEILRAFYGVIKDLDPYLKFVFLTGVSKFSKTSIFSGLNNLEDISLSAAYNDLLGYTQDEISIYFEDHLAHAAQIMKCSEQELREEITAWYDGYRFTKNDNSTRIYNPFSVMLCLKNSDFSNYWFQTGTPTFLINLLKSKNYPIQDFESIEATEPEMGQFEVNDIALKTLLFQTGYLTIHGYNPKSRNYVLGFPNKETTASLIEYIFASMTHVSGAYLNNIAVALIEAFNLSDFEQIGKSLTQLFASVPYTIHIGEEKYYQTIFYLVLKMIGADIIVEQPTNIGRIDAVLQTKNSFFIIEFKINSTAKKAIEQIKEKKYYQPYESLGKSIILVGIAFDTVLKNISEIEHVFYALSSEK